MINAWPIVLDQIPGSRLVLVGDGPERPQLEALVRDLKLDGSVSLPGSMADPAVELRRSDLFVLPSREEGMSIALLEAMALRIPIVASDIPGNRVLITPGVHGRLAPPDDPLTLAWTIITHHCDRKIPIMAHAARARVEADYSIAAVARRHLALFEVLVGAKV